METHLGVDYPNEVPLPAARGDEALAKGLSTLRGDLVSKPVAEAFGFSYTDPAAILK